MARQGETYVALYSHQPAVWTENSEYRDRELVAEGSQNVWICHVGDLQTYSNFSTFTEAVLQSQVRVELAREEEEDELAGCLRTEDCLGGDLVRTVGCLSPGAPCSLSRLKHSAIARCLLSQPGAGPDLAQLARAGVEAANQSVAHLRLVAGYLECLTTAQTEISVSFAISGSQLNMDWSGELTYQVNHQISDIRYHLTARARETPSRPP